MDGGNDYGTAGNQKWKARIFFIGESVLSEDVEIK